MMVRTTLFLLAFLCFLGITNQLFTKPETAPENSTFDAAVNKVKTLLNSNKDESSVSDSSSSDSSDSDGKDSKIDALLANAKDTRQDISQNLKEARKNAKREAKKAWKKLRQEIISESDATNTSFEELNARLKNAKKDLKKKAIENWKELRNKMTSTNASSDSSDSSSDSDAKESKIGALLGSAKNASLDLKGYKKTIKKEAKDSWKLLRQEIIAEANATNTSYDELSFRLKSAKKDLKRRAKEKWRAFRNKASELNATMTDGMPNA